MESVTQAQILNKTAFYCVLMSLREGTNPSILAMDKMIGQTGFFSLSKATNL